MTQPEHDPGPQVHRSHVVAAIHAYAEWLAVNPDVPLPTEIDGHRHTSRHNGDSVAEVRHMITNYDAARYTSGNNGWSITTVMTEPIKIEHTVFCDRPTPRPDEQWL